MGLLGRRTTQPMDHPSPMKGSPMTAPRKTTTRRPAAKTAPALVVDEIDLADLDFDNWSEEDEQAALVRLQEELKPKFLIVEKSVAAKFPSGFIIKTSVDIQYDKLTEITAAGEQADDQIMAVLEFLGQGDEVAELQRQGIVSVMAFAQKYFEVWQKVAGAPMGESRGSTGS